MGLAVDCAILLLVCAVGAAATVLVWPAKSVLPSTTVSACPAPCSSATAPSAPTPPSARSAAMATTPPRAPVLLAQLAAFPAKTAAPAPNALTLSTLVQEHATNVVIV